MTTNHNDWHFLFVEFSDRSTDRIRSKSIQTLVDYLKNNNQLVKNYDLSNQVPRTMISQYEILE